mmetsp:Transcript_123435/g.360451  ORF Transcript_123435/g.360451 Transcript_123435/m.360451 type:complete len:709 (-) Transcript_123435:91-2217(-)
MAPAVCCTSRTSPVFLALLLGVSGLRFKDGPDLDPAMSLRMDTGYGSDIASETEDWPDKWIDAHAHGRFLAKQLTNQTLNGFLHAYTGPADSYYAGQTMPLPDYGIPSMKMHHAIPGWQPRNPEEAARVTTFPSYLALASTWDPYMVGEVALAVTEEFKTLGANAMFGPAISVHRATMHDEDFDSLSGEDPTLGSVMTRHWVLAAQTNGIMTIPKYFGGVEQGPVHFDNASANLTSWDMFYPPFETAVDCGAAGIMCADHEINGLWACRDKQLLQRDLKDIMGFHGMVVSTPGAAKDVFAYQSSYERGLDLEVGEKSRVPLSDHQMVGMRDAAVRVLSAIWHMKLEEGELGCTPPNCTEELARDARTPEHLDVARRASGSAVTLLKNEGLLPLTPDKYKTVALLGPGSVHTGSKTEGDYYSGAYEAHVPKDDYVPPVVGIYLRGKKLGITVTNKTEGADVCVVIGGSHLYAGHWRLDNQTLAAIDVALSECNSTAVLMEISGAVLTPFRSKVQAIAALFHAGQETTFAWAATLFGDASPSGKLPISFPLVGQDTNSWWTQAVPSYWSPDFKAAYPFGHGLSYADFVYSDFKVKPLCHFPLCVMVTVLNNSTKHSGAEVVQVYFKFKPEVGHPTVLRAFYKTKVLKPGKKEKVFFSFNYRDTCLYLDRDGQTEKERSWKPQKEFDVLFAASSQDVRGSLTVQPKWTGVR